MIGITPGWYVPVALSLNLFMGLSALVFLCTLRPDLKENWTWTGRGVRVVAVAMIYTAYRGVQRLVPGGLRPSFRSDIDAILALGPIILMGTAVICFLIDTWGYRFGRRRQ